MKTPRRQSNIELLRIVSMLMIVLVHIDGASLGLPQIEGDFSQLSSRSAWQIGVESLTIIGVNCFTLISGYFSIRLRWRSAAAYLLQCAFYSVGIYILLCLTGRATITPSQLLESAMVLTHTDLWYVPAYFMLMLLAPLINAGFDRLSRRHALYLTLALTAYNVWGGWLWHGGFNPTGYTVMQLVMVYCIGRCLALFRSTLIDHFRRPAIMWMGIYLLFTAGTSAFACYNPPMAYAYNQPMVIGAAIAFFLCFASLNIQSNLINTAARSSFAVYLIHKSPAIWGGVMRPTVITLWTTLSLWEFTAAAILLTLAIYLLAMIIDPLRRYIFKKIHL